MKNTFFAEICQGISSGHFQPIGYSEDDIIKLEKLYAFKAIGMLRAFLVEMGRSSGGLFGDEITLLYFSEFNIRDHIIFQYNFFRSMQDTDNHEFLDSPFVFALLAETQYCFVRTTSGDPDAVHIFDSNNGSVRNSGEKLDSFIRSLIDNEQDGFISTGDMLRIS